MFDSGLIYLAYPLAVAFAITLAVGIPVIKLMKRLKFGQQVRSDGPQTHLVKQNVPTMGGVMMLAAIAVVSLLFQLKSVAMVAMLATLGYGIIGFLDDFIKVYKKRSLGLKAYQKIVGQFGIAAIMAVYAYNSPLIGSSIYLPFSGTYIDLGWMYIPFAVFVIIAIVNAANLTDGLDGLASNVTLVMALTFAFLIGSMALNAGILGQLNLSEEYRSLAMLASILAGTCLGFLCYNIYPARIFMGDTGALAIGGMLAMLGLFSKMSLLLPIMGIMLVVTCVSVILQVGSFKLRHGKRIFRMAPLHHHYELKGYHETTIAAMYTIITFAACLLSLVIVLR